MTAIEIVRGDITEQKVDAVVNAANSSLLGGGGVDGAIHRAGGPDILAECRQLRAGRYRDGLPTGSAVATTAGRLKAEYVIHTVGPVFSRSDDRTAMLESAYRSSLDVAGRIGARSVAFPAISAGVYGWPMADAARVAIAMVRSVCGGAGDRENRLDLVRFVLFSSDAMQAFREAWPAGV